MALAGPPTSIQRSHLINGPIPEDGFAVYVFFRYQPPHPAIVGLVAVIAENIVVTGFHINGWIGAVIEIFRQDVVLVERLFVDVDDAALDLHDVTRHTNDAFDV